MAAPGWVLVEWPDRAGNTLPADRLEIEIQIDSETGRTLLLTPRGLLHEQLVASVRERVQEGLAAITASPPKGLLRGLSDI